MSFRRKTEDVKVIDEQAKEAEMDQRNVQRETPTPPVEYNQEDLGRKYRKYGGQRQLVMSSSTKSPSSASWTDQSQWQEKQAGWTNKPAQEWQEKGQNWQEKGQKWQEKGQKWTEKGQKWTEKGGNWKEKSGPKWNWVEKKLRNQWSDKGLDIEGIGSALNLTDILRSQARAKNGSKIINWMIKNMADGKQTIIVL